MVIVSLIFNRMNMHNGRMYAKLKKSVCENQFYITSVSRNVTGHETAWWFGGNQHTDFGDDLLMSVSVI
jgi:hypothetical protein